MLCLISVNDSRANKNVQLGCALVEAQRAPITLKCARLRVLKTLKKGLVSSKCYSMQAHKYKVNRE